MSSSQSDLKIFDESLNDKDKLWRYTSFPKLLNLFETSVDGREIMRLVSLRADKFEDSFEGTLSTEAEGRLRKNILDNWESWWKMAGRPNRWYPDAVQAQDYRDFVQQSVLYEQQNLKERIQKMRKNTYLHCWRKADDEDSVMWGAYTTNSDGIVIQTTVGKLRDSIRDYDGNMYLGTVDYIDFGCEDMKLSFVSPYFYKQCEFGSESEFRIVLSDISEKKFKGMDPNEMTTSSPSKREIIVDRNDLINEIRVHPKSPNYFKKVVERTLDNLDLGIPVKHSSLRSSLHKK